PIRRVRSMTWGATAAEGARTQQFGPRFRHRDGGVAAGSLDFGTPKFWLSTDQQGLTTRARIDDWEGFEALASLVELVLIALLFPLVILLLGLPVALLVRILLRTRSGSDAHDSLACDAINVTD